MFEFNTPMTTEHKKTRLRSQVFDVIFM